MVYHYRCLQCGAARWRDWDNRAKVLPCLECKAPTRAPTPEEQPDAWVDERDAPDEMKSAALRGNRKHDHNPSQGDSCIVPWCTSAAQDVDHRIAYMPGRTSASNLVPMCRAHKASKGGRDLDEWMGEAETIDLAGRKAV